MKKVIDFAAYKKDKKEKEIDDLVDVFAEFFKEQLEIEKELGKEATKNGKF